MTLGYEIMALDAMNISGLWMTYMTSCHELKILNVMNNLGL